MNRELARVSIVSGVLWGAVALACMAGTFSMSHRILIRNLLLFTMSGAVVGLAAGAVLQRLRKGGILTLTATAGGMLLVATVVFALVLTTAAEVLTAGEVHHPPSSAIARILEAPILWLYGLFRSGFVLLLWPLAVLNHLWFFRVRGAAGR